MNQNKKGDKTISDNEVFVVANPPIEGVISSSTPRPVDGMEERARKWVDDARKDNCQSMVAIARSFAESEVERYKNEIAKKTDN